MGRIRARAAGIVALLLATAAPAAVERIEISERTPLADGMRFGAAGAYEKIRGFAWIALDPDKPANARIVDLKNAARDGHGHVVFKSEFMMLRPVDPARRNGTLLYEVNNRGNIGILKQVNAGPSTAADASSREDVGNGFLFRQGFTLLWSAWAWDTRPSTPQARVFHLDPPVATDHGRTITGKVVYEILVDQPSPTAIFTGRASRAYPHAIGADPGATLTMRENGKGARRTIARNKWRFVPATDGLAPDTLALDGGFEPGRLYELTYLARDPVVVGAGLAGVRDLLSWFKANRFEGAAPLDRALVFGLSQSGRMITTMLTLGLNIDEGGKPAFDGGYAQVGGAGKGSFNHRFAMSTRHFSPLVDQIYPTDYFPFATVPTRDPATGRIASILDTARAAGPLPKMFFVNTSLEYWGRAASLLTTTPDGKQDVAVDPSARVFMIAGAQHYVGVSKTRAPFNNCVNNADHYPVERALIVALDNWVRGAAAPPASAYPTIAGGDLVSRDLYRRLFPIADMRVPDSQLRPPRLDLGPRFASEGIVDKTPPVAGAPFNALVPRPDQDGNDHAGIRLVEVEAPLGSRLGWNLRAPETGFAGVQTRYDGSFVPFARTRAERAPGDSRQPIAERYRDKADFLRRVRAAAERQVAAGTLLRIDMDLVLAEQSGLYDRVMAHDPKDLTCNFLYP